MKNIFIIFIILYLDLIAFTIILPLFPSIIDHYDKQSSDDAALQYIHTVMDSIKTTLHMPERSRYNSVLIGGILGSLFSLLQFFSSPIIGSFSDLFGRKYVLLLSMVGTSLSYFLWWKADVFSIFLLSRIVGGLAKGSVTLCTTMMSDITTKENRGKGMAFIGLSFSFGFITGPLIGAYFAMRANNDSTTTNIFVYPAQISLVIQLFTLILVLFVLDETSPLTNKCSWIACWKKSLSLVNPKNMFYVGNKSATKTTLVNFLYLLFFAGLEFTLTFLTHERFHFTSMQQGRLFFFAGIIMMLVQGGYVRRVKNKEKSVAIQGIAVIIPAMLLLAFTKTVNLTYAALTLYSLSAGTVVPCLTSLFSQHCSESESGEKIGIFRSAGALARAVAPVLTCTTDFSALFDNKVVIAIIMQSALPNLVETIALLVLMIYWSFGSAICYFSGALCFILPLLLLTRVQPSTIDVKKSD